jgi:hypothetical protein
MLPPEITACLAPGERVLWSGQPRPYVFMLRGLTSICYGATWSILGAFWYRGSGGIGEYSAFEGWWKLIPLLSLPFILAGFSFFLYPIRLGARARRTWYLVTNQRVFIAEVKRQNQPLMLRVFAPEEMAAPQVMRRFDGLEDVILTRHAQEYKHLTPRLESGFFGLKDGNAAAQAIESTTNP